MSTTTSLMTAPGVTCFTLPLSWLRALISIGSLWGRTIPARRRSDKTAAGYGNPADERSLGRVAVGVLDDLDLLEGDESAAACGLDHGVEHRKRRTDLLLAVDDLEDDRQVLGKPEYLGGVDPTARAVGLDPAPHRGAGQPELARLLPERLVERPAVVPVGLADEDAKEMSRARDLHGPLTGTVRRRSRPMRRRCTRRTRCQCFPARGAARRHAGGRASRS